MKVQEEVVVIGLGYVGLTLSAYLANIGMKVHGVEIRDTVLSNLEKHRAFFLEKNLDEILEIVITNKKFSFSKVIPIVEKRRIFIITVGTPLTNNLSPNLDYIKRASEEVAKTLNNGDLVILRSTVKLGVTNSVVREILNTSNKEFSLAFCPERTLEGAALNEIGKLPQIIGADNDYDKELATEFFKRVTSSIMTVSNIETAEMIKLVDNMQRDAHFAISNEVARMCNQVNIKASEVISAGKYKYPRTNLPTPGPVGGPCLEKDTYILNDSFSLPISLSKTARAVNESIVDDSLIFFKKYFKEKISDDKTSLKIGVIGLAFKGVPETNDLRGSVALKVISELKINFRNVQICAFDPVIVEEDTKDLEIELVGNYQEAFAKSDLVLLLNNHPIICEINLGYMANIMNIGGMIYDYWGRFDEVTTLPNKIVSSSWGSHGNLNGGIYG